MSSKPDPTLVALKGIALLLQQVVYELQAQNAAAQHGARRWNIYYPHSETYSPSAHLQSLLAQSIEKSSKDTAHGDTQSEEPT